MIVVALTSLRVGFDHLTAVLYPYRTLSPQLFAALVFSVLGHIAGFKALSFI